MLKWFKQERSVVPPRIEAEPAPEPVRSEPVAWRTVIREAVLELDAEGRARSVTLGRQGTLAALEGEVGRYLVDRLRASDRVVFLHAHARVRGGEARADIEVSLRLDENGRDWADVAVALVHGADGAVALLTDRTVREPEPELDVDDTVETAPDHDPLADLAHELRTPLNAVSGYAGALRAELFGPLNARQSEAVRAIEEASQHVVELSNAVLDAARFGASAAVDPEVGTIDGSVERACGLVANLAARHGVTIANRVTERSGTVPHDAAALRQVVLNLLSNAVKASSAGGTVSVEAVQSDGAMEIAVRDTGCGMGIDQVAALGTRFARGQAARGEATGGLGLPLVRRLVEAHGGTLRFTSKPGSGTLATVRLPQKASGLRPTVVPIAARVVPENENDGTRSNARMVV